jgi:hypothetical protein
MTQEQRELRDYLKLMALCHVGNGPKPKGWHYHGPADLLLREAQFYQPAKLAKRWERSLPHACFRNAALYAVLHKLRYVEGYAQGVIPVHHAWCADKAGNAIEVTWPFMGALYFGVEFPPMLVTKGAVLFNEKNMTIYRRKISNPKGAQRNENQQRSSE